MDFEVGSSEAVFVYCERRNDEKDAKLPSRISDGKSMDSEVSSSEAVLVYCERRNDEEGAILLSLRSSY